MGTEDDHPINRKDPLKWHHPRAHLQDYSGGDIRLWLAIIFIELPMLVRWYCWHKWQSAKANRVNIAIEARVAAQHLDFLEQSDDLPEHKKYDARQAKRSLRTIADELNIESDALDRHLTMEDDA